MFIRLDLDKRPKLVVTEHCGIILRNKGSLDRNTATNKLMVMTYVNVPTRPTLSFISWDTVLSRSLKRVIKVSSISFAHHLQKQSCK